MIPEPGAYFDTPEAVHHSWRCASKSTLRHWVKSMAHVKAAMDSPSRQTDDTLLGTQFHALVLEPAKFAERAVKAPAMDKRTKAWKDWIAEQREGAWLIDESDWANLHAAREAVLSNPEAAKLLGREGKNEVSIVFDEMGVRCKARIDRLTRPAVVDLKKTRSAWWRDFQWHAQDYGYYLGAELYLRGARKVFKWESPPPFIIIAAELEPPYGVGVFHMQSEYVAEELDCALRRYAECERTGVWPGYGTGIFDLIEPRKRFIGDSG